METIKKGDFVEVEYTGILKENNFVFDTTDVKTAKENNIYNESMQYGTVIVCIGEGPLLRGLDEQLDGKELNKEFTIELSPEKAFGKKDGKLLKIVPASAFTKQKINPVPGLQINIDGQLGTIKTATGGRTIVDFNHPFSGRDVIYKIKANRIVTDDLEKMMAFLSLEFGMKDAECEIKEGIAEVKMAEDINLPEEIGKMVNERVNRLIPSIKSVKFIKK